MIARDRLSPVQVGAAAVLVATCFVGLRWAVAAHGDISRFVVAGSDYTSRGAGVTVSPGHGYDGQFSYRLAVDPTRLGRRAHGIVLDSPLRLQRMTYPVAAYLLALGQRAAVPWTLVVVNVLGLGLLAGLSAALAREYDRPAWLGLAVAGFFGFLTTLGRDLNEITTAALLVAGVLAWQRHRPAVAAGAFTGAVLSRESVLPMYVAFAAVELRHASWRARLAALVPVAVFVCWQAICAGVTGHVPLLSSSGKNLVLPFRALLPAAAGWFHDAAHLDRGALIDSGQLVALAVVVVAAASALRRSQAAAGVKAAWAVALLLVASLSSNVWDGPADFRTAAELSVLSAIVLLGSDRRLRVPWVLLGIAWLMTALFRVTSI